MKLKSIIILLILFLSTGLSFLSYSQLLSKEAVLSKIRIEGFSNSNAMNILSQLTDIYGQRLTGSREYYRAAKWIADEMRSIGLENIHFENYCADCRGWSIKSFNIEMVAPNYMHISGYPLAMTKSTDGVVSGDVLSIENVDDLDAIRKEYAGKIKGKIILLGKETQKKSLLDTLMFQFTEEQLIKMEEQLTAEKENIPLPELFTEWEVNDRSDKEFLTFLEAEGVLALLTSQPMYLGVLHPEGTYYYRENELKPLPYFTIMPEHFNRLYRMIKLNTVPTISLNLETEFYNESENNVNIIGEIMGNHATLKFEEILIGAHFDSWHSATGATDNGVNCVVFLEALRILKQIGYQPKRTIKIGLWGGEEQSYLGSAAYAKDHFGALDEKPNVQSKKVSAYLNLDEGAGAIRGVFLQGNEAARPFFKEIFNPISDLTSGVITIENIFLTDHETFDYYNIPSFQFIQDEISYYSVNHHSELDFLEYVHEDDIMKNAILIAWTIYYLDNMQEKMPRK